MQRSSPLAGGWVQSRFGKTLSHVVTVHCKHCMAASAIGRRRNSSKLSQPVQSSDYFCEWSYLVHGLRIFKFPYYYTSWTSISCSFLTCCKLPTQLWRIHIIYSLFLYICVWLFYGISNICTVQDCSSSVHSWDKGTTTRDGVGGQDPSTFLLTSP